MHVLLYNLSLFFYHLGISVASLFNAKAKLWVEGRKDWQEKIQRANLSSAKRIWIHCASLGEFEQARPLIEKLKDQHSKTNTKITLTFFSPSGFEIRKNFEHADLVLYLPLDSKANAEEFLDLIKPDVALFVKYEFWFHYLMALKQRNIPSVLFSSTFRSEQIFFKWYAGLFRQMLQSFSKIFVQNNTSKELLKSISIESEVCFDTRFDRVFQIAQNRKQFPLVEKFKGNAKILIAGSTWEKDEELLAQCINENVLNGYKLIIAPHQIELKRIDALQQRLKAKSILFSELREENALQAEVLFIDNIGNLSSLYAYAEIAYIGGGFNASVHNILEAVVYGIPVVFGPNFQKSEEAKELIDLGEAFSVSSFDELKNALTKIVGENANHGKWKGKEFVAERTGGTEKIFNYINQVL